MTGKACVIVILGSLWIAPSFAQAAVGGPKKSQNYIGGPARQANPVVPPRRGDVVRTQQPAPKPPKH